MSKFPSSRWSCSGWFAIALLAISLAPGNFVAAEEQGEKPDEDAIRECVDSYVTAYNRHDAKAVAALWSENGEWLSPSGERFKGREAIADALGTIFESRDGLRIEVAKPAIRLVTPDVAVEEGSVQVFSDSAPPSDSAYVAVHVKKDGRWYLDSVRETESAQSPVANSPLQDLAWLVGQWGDADTDGATQANVAWTKNQTFLSYSFKASIPEEDDLEGTQIIGWDPAAGTIRSWMFDSDGGFGEGIWSQKGDSWVVKFSQVLSDGRTARATNVYTPIDGNTFTWKSVGREVDGEYLPNIEEVKITRQGSPVADDKPAAAKTKAKKTKKAKR